MRSSKLFLACACGFLSLASLVKADSVLFTLDTTAGTYGTHNPAGPWATATFTQDDAHTVTLDLHALPGLGHSFISGWALIPLLPRAI